MSGTKILWGQILIVFTIVLTTTWAATRWTAWRLGFQAQLSAPWFEISDWPIYYPPAFFWWWYFYDAYAPPIFIEGAIIAASGGFIAIAVAILMSIWRAREAQNVDTYGSARWAKPDEIRAAGLLGSDGVVPGKLEADYPQPPATQRATPTTPRIPAASARHYRYGLQGDSPPWRPVSVFADGLTISQHGAVSIDGERIPYTQIGPATSDGNAPVHLSGYGGFRLSRLPSYGMAIGKLWLEGGGTAVIANIRGGGEFGTRWHEAGRREGKRLSHDDFAAVAADLVLRGVTTPKRIAAEGGSNGGILITNMLTRYPERFGALFCTIPLIDMRRYTRLLAGASWIDEYGDPDKPEDWSFLQTYSAYHMAEPGRPYPPILLATTRRDDRVHPGHARKMAAKLQAMGYHAHFYEPAAGGHGYGKDNRETASFIALGYGFLRQSIGWAPT